MIVEASTCVHIQRQVELCTTLMVLRFALASTRPRAPLLTFAGAIVRLSATHAITLRSAPHLLCTTRCVFSVRRFTVAPTPLDIPLLVGVTDGGVLRTSAGTLGVVHHLNGFVAKCLQILRHYFDMGDVTGYASFVSRFVDAH